jgi:hypothetical protein
MLLRKSADPLPKLDNAVAVRDAVARLIADVLSGTLHPRVAAGLAPLMNLQLRAIEAVEWANVNERLSRLEKMLPELEKSSDESGERNEQTHRDRGESWKSVGMVLHRTSG